MHAHFQARLLRNTQGPAELKRNQTKPNQTFAR